MLTPRLYADSTVFVLTGYRALKLSRIARGGVQSLIDIILRDGVSPSHLPRVSRLCPSRHYLLRHDLHRRPRQRAHLPGALPSTLLRVLNHA